MEHVTYSPPVEHSWSARLAQELEAFRSHLAGAAPPRATNLPVAILNNTAGSRLDPGQALASGGHG